MKRILIPIDGSEYSKTAILEGKKLAEAFGSEILLLYVEWQKPEVPYVDVHIYRNQGDLDKIGDQIINNGLELLNNFSGSLTSKIEFGDPGDVIIKVAEEENMDLIVMGSRGLTGIKRFVLGSVSTKVLNHSHTSVLVIR